MPAELKKPEREQRAKNLRQKQRISAKNVRVKEKSESDTVSGAMALSENSQIQTPSNAFKKKSLRELLKIEKVRPKASHKKAFKHNLEPRKMTNISSILHKKKKQLVQNSSVNFSMDRSQPVPKVLKYKKTAQVSRSDKKQTGQYNSRKTSKERPKAVLTKKYSTISHSSQNSRHIPQVGYLKVQKRVTHDLPMTKKTPEKKQLYYSSTNNAVIKRSSYSPIKRKKSIKIMKNKSVLHVSVKSEIRKKKRTPKKATPKRAGKQQKERTTSKIKKKSKTPSKVRSVKKSATPKKTKAKKRQITSSRLPKKTVSKGRIAKKGPRKINLNEYKSKSRSNHSVIRREQPKPKLRKVKSILPQRESKKTQLTQKKAKPVTLESLKKQNRRIHVDKGKKRESKSGVRILSRQLKSAKRGEKRQKLAELDNLEKHSKTMENYVPPKKGGTRPINNVTNNYHTTQQNTLSSDFQMGSTVSDNYNSNQPPDQGDSINRISQTDIQVRMEHSRSKQALINLKSSNYFNLNERRKLTPQQSTPQFKMGLLTSSQKNSVTDFRLPQIRQNQIITRQPISHSKSLKSSQALADSRSLAHKSSSSRKHVASKSPADAHRHAIKRIVSKQAVSRQDNLSLSNSGTPNTLSKNTFSRLRVSGLARSLTVSENSGSQILSSFDNSDQKQRKLSSTEDFGNRRVSIPVDKLETEVFIQTNEISRNSLTLEASRELAQTGKREELHLEYDKMMKSFNKTHDAPISFSQIQKDSRRVRRVISNDLGRASDPNPSQSNLSSLINVRDNQSRYLERRAPFEVQKPELAKAPVVKLVSRESRAPQIVLNRSSNSQMHMFKKEKGSKSGEYRLVGSKNAYADFEYIPGGAHNRPERVEGTSFNKRTIIRKSGKKEEFLIQSKKPAKISITSGGASRVLKPKILKVSITRKQQRLTHESKTSKPSFGSYRNLVGKVRPDKGYGNNFTPKKPKFSIITKNYRDSHNDSESHSARKTHSTVNIKELPTIDSGEFPRNRVHASPKPPSQLAAYSLESTPIKGSPRPLGSNHGKRSRQSKGVDKGLIG